ncbi:MAG: DNA topoisomerase I [Planctomycetales bacterium]
MGSLIRLLLGLQVLSPVLRPLVRLLVGAIAVPLFRLFVRRLVRLDRLSAELTKDLEQWVRGSLLLLVATANVEHAILARLVEVRLPENLHDEYAWLSLGLRLLIAVGVIEAMPDQALFSIIHPGPTRLLFPKGRRLQAVREQWWPLCRGFLCRHLDRSSSVFAILSVIFGGRNHPGVGWICYTLAIVQFLIIGLVSSRDKALDVLSQFDEQMRQRRQEIEERLHESAVARPPQSLADLARSSDQTPPAPPGDRGNSSATDNRPGPT